MSTIVPFHDHQLHIIPVEDALLYTARLRREYVNDANTWTAHGQTKRVDAKFARYAHALTVIKRRPELKDDSPEKIQQRLDAALPMP